MKNNKTIAYTAVFTALAFILSYLESLLPAFTGIPGVKPGFANIVVLVALAVLGVREAVLIAVIRIILSGFAFNGMFAMIYSFAGAALSLATIIILSKASFKTVKDGTEGHKKTGRFGTTGISIAGGVMHNVGQVIAAVVVTGPAVFYYLPILIISGIIAGAITGIIAGLTTARLQRNV